MKNILILLAIFFIGCNGNQIHLETDSQLKKHFSREELNRLGNAVAYFDSIATVTYNTNNLDDAFSKLIDTIGINYHAGYRLLKSHNFNHNRFFYSILKQSLSDKIWCKEFGLKGPTSKDTMAIGLQFDMDEAYIQYLRDRAQTDSAIDKYIANIEQCSCIWPFFLSKRDKYNFNDESTRLIWSLHIFTMTFEKVSNRYNDLPLDECYIRPDSLLNAGE